MDVDEADIPVVVDHTALDQLPADHLLRLQLGQKQVFICGTAHVSNESVDLVTKVVNAVQPQVLMLELCASRTNLLLPPSEKTTENAEKSSGSAFSQAKEVMSARQGLSGAFQLALGYFYQKVGSEIKIQPGAEFRAALQAVQQGRVPCQLVLGDRAIGVTIQRAWALLPLVEKLKLAFQLAKAMVTPISKEDIERMKQSDVLTELMLEFCEYFPSLSRVLLLERDLYLARSIVGISMNADTGDRVVAVVGLGHLKGMQEALERWKKNPELIQEECKDLTFVPPTPFTGRRMALLFVLIAILIGVLVFFGARQVIRWIF